MTDPALLEAVEWYTGVAGTVDEARARELLEEAVARETPLAVMWRARVHSTGRMGYPRDEELAREIAGTVIRDVQRAAESGIREASIRSGRRRGTAGPPNAGMSWAPTTWAMHTPPGGASPRIMSSRPQPGTRRRGKRWSASGAGRCFSSVAPPGPAPVQGRADLLRRAHLHSLDSGGIAVGATAPRSSGGESVLQRNRPRPGTKPNRGRDWRGSRKPATRSSPPACSRSRR